MMMSAEEIKVFWEEFCDRHNLAADLIIKGNTRIDQAPEYWADHTMWDLLEEIRKSS